MRNGRNYLFADGDLSAALRSNLARVSAAVDSLSKDQFLATPEEDLIEHLMSRLAIEPLELHEDHMETTEGETQVDVSGDRDRYFSGHRSGPAYVPGHKIEINIPYSGAYELWKLKPSSWQSIFPVGIVLPHRGNQPGILHIEYSMPVDNLDEARLGNNISRDLETIRFYVNRSATEVKGHLVELERSVRAAIRSRKERFQKTEGIATRLGLPLKRREGAPDIEAIKLPRKLVRPLPEARVGSYQPEYGIDDKTYEHILAVIRHEIATFEATPATYKGLGEEDLRNIMLAHLNGHYEGGATGETFRKSGKTDIRIEAENRAAFIAECKLWSGPAALSAAVDQLLGYLTWRDCKAALIFFNKEVKNYAAILDKSSVELKAHRLFKRVVSEGNPAEFRYIFQSASDDSREVTLHIFLADLYVTRHV